jgi:hypothetical protein
MKMEGEFCQLATPAGALAQSGLGKQVSQDSRQAAKA